MICYESGNPRAKGMVEFQTKLTYGMICYSNGLIRRVVFDDVSN